MAKVEWEETMNGNWFTDQRQLWIAETLGIFGFINREHIKRKFGISTPQASADLQDYQIKNPDAIVYDKKQKRYTVVGGHF